METNGREWKAFRVISAASVTSVVRFVGANAIAPSDPTAA